MSKNPQEVQSYRDNVTRPLLSPKRVINNKKLESTFVRSDIKMNNDKILSQGFQTGVTEQSDLSNEMHINDNQQ